MKIKYTDSVNEGKVMETTKSALREKFIQGLKSCAERIVEQNKALLVRVKMCGFKPARELDFTDNGAVIYLHRFFEAVAKFEEGKVPCEELKELFKTTDLLIDELKKLKNAPICELEDAGVAFRLASSLWKDNYAEPLMERRVYLKKHFACEKEICDKLKRLHAAYVRISAAKGRKKDTLSAASSIGEDFAINKEKRKILVEIDRLVKMGNSASKAIKIMKSGVYEARMRGIKMETWRRYYSEYLRQKELRKRRNETINEPHETVNETVNGAFETVNVPRETVNETIKADDETINETIKSVIRTKSGISGKMIVEMVSKSRATVMRVLASLKRSGEIVYRGSKKTGGYYVVERSF